MTHTQSQALWDLYMAVEEAWLQVCERLTHIRTITPTKEWSLYAKRMWLACKSPMHVCTYNTHSRIGYDVPAVLAVCVCLHAVRGL